MCRKRLLRLLPPWESGAALDLVGAQKSSNLFLNLHQFTTTRNDQFIVGFSKTRGANTWDSWCFSRKSIPCYPLVHDAMLSEV